MIRAIQPRAPASVRSMSAQRSILVISLLTGLIGLSYLLELPVQLRIVILLALAIMLFRDVVQTSLPSNPLWMFAAAWSFVLSTYYSEILIYYLAVDSGPPLLFLAGGIALVFLGYALGRGRGGRAQYRGAGASQAVLSDMFIRSVYRKRMLITVGALCACASALCLGLELFVVYGATFAEINNLRSIAISKEPTALSQLAAILAPGGLLALCGVVFIGSSVSKPMLGLWVLGAVAPSALSLFTAGRQTVLQLCLALAISVSIRRRITGYRSPIAPWFTAGIIGFVFFYQAYVGMMRNDGRVAVYKHAVLLYIFQARVNGDISSPFSSSPLFVQDSLTEAVIYSTQSLPAFITLWYQDYGPRQNGLFSFPFITRRLQTFFPNIKSPLDRIRDYVAAMKPSGRFAQTWYTTYRDVLFDFGIPGAYGFGFIFGYVVARVRRHVEQKPAFGGAVLVVCLGIIGAYFPLVSALSDTTILLATICAVALYRTETKAQRRGLRRHMMPAPEACYDL